MRLRVGSPAASFERPHFVRGERPEGSGGERAERERPEMGAHEARHPEAEDFAHAPDLALLALGDLDLEARRILRIGGRCGGDREDSRRASAEPGLDRHPGGKLLEIGRPRRGRRPDAVALRHVIARMEEAVREIAVVGEEKEALRIEIQSTHGEDTGGFGARRGDRAPNGGPAGP